MILVWKGCDTLPDPYYLKGTTIYLADSERVEYIMPLPDNGGADAARLGMYISKKWPREKRVYNIFFTDGDADIISKTMGDWELAITTKTGVQYVRTVNRAVADMAVSFTPNNQAWSYIGTDCGILAKNRTTMNLGWHLRYRDNQGGERYGTGVHEMKHAMGYVHMLQDPACAGTLVWNKEVVYANYLRSQGWDRAMVDAQVFTPYPVKDIDHNGCDFKSIMCYSVRAGEANVVVGRNNEMSPTDDAKVIADYKAGTDPVKPIDTVITKPDDKNILLVSRNKPARQSSTNWHDAKNINNGNYNDINHTNMEDYPWIQIDMGTAVKYITRIDIYNRKGCAACVGRLKDFKVYASMDSTINYTNTSVYVHNTVVADGQKISIYLSDVTARYITFMANNTATGKPKFLHLAEMEVFAKGFYTEPVDPVKPVCKDTIYKVPVMIWGTKDSVGKVCR